MSYISPEEITIKPAKCGVFQQFVQYKNGSLSKEQPNSALFEKFVHSSRISKDSSFIPTIDISQEYTIEFPINDLSNLPYPREWVFSLINISNPSININDTFIIESFEKLNETDAKLDNQATNRIRLNICLATPVAHSTSNVLKSGFYILQCPMLDFYLSVMVQYTLLSLNNHSKDSNLLFPNISNLTSNTNVSNTGDISISSTTMLHSPSKSNFSSSISLVSPIQSTIEESYEDYNDNTNTTGIDSINNITSDTVHYPSQNIQRSVNASPLRSQILENSKEEWTAEISNKDNNIRDINNPTIKITTTNSILSTDNPSVISLQNEIVPKLQKQNSHQQQQQLYSSVVTNINSISHHGYIPFPEHLDNWIPDGPHFRYQLQFLENSILHRQPHIWKSINNRLIKILETLTSVTSECFYLNKYIKSAFKFQIPNNHPLYSPVVISLKNLINSQINEIDSIIFQFKNILIPPVTDILNNSVNLKESSKRQKIYLENSKSFYSAMNQKAKTHTFANKQKNIDLTLKIKKKFELSRIDYYDYLYQSFYSGLPLRKLHSSIYLLNEINSHSMMSNSNLITSKLIRNLLKDKLTELNNYETKNFISKYQPSVQSIYNQIEKSTTYNDINKTYFPLDLDIKEGVLWVKNNKNLPPSSNSLSANITPTTTFNSNFNSPNTMANNLIMNNESHSNKLISAASNTSTSSGWHKNWVVLKGSTLTLFTNWKKLDPVNQATGVAYSSAQIVPSSANSSHDSLSLSDKHIINMAMACTKQIDPCTFEILTSNQLNKKGIRFQAESPDDLKSWLNVLNMATHDVLATYSQGNSQTSSNGIIIYTCSDGHNINVLKNKNKPLMVVSEKEIQGHQININSHDHIKKSHVSTLSDTLKINTNPVKQPSSSSLLDIVRQNDKSNLICCDCGDTNDVEWISINLLCMVCIKCSGIHRSLGSHVSKIRSLTLDKFSNNELNYLIVNNVSNAIFNSIYESDITNLNKIGKITANSSNSERTIFIKNKYITKSFVEDNKQESAETLKSLRKGIQLDSVYLLQKSIAQSKNSLRDVDNYSNSINSDNNTSLFESSLKHYKMVNDKPLFGISEFLISNGLPLNNIPSETSYILPESLKYWRSRLEIYGTFGVLTTPKTVYASQNIVRPINTKNNSPANRLDINDTRVEDSGHRWNISPKSPQILKNSSKLFIPKQLKKASNK
ncbi:hypothetical protein TBLA_0A07450 [Henningerozyma blattae CBS 6284]|uniref:ADP-ribosylation factor GTPase-activating protein n=1 Tax=Henningerozyma blattae (strain ATCC 34711 / CBS 6284 / DSM 70876 / NBRC 10599 / NRRL Y-10934 / UCD 77-7) TaxID=1071380 RepID=I2GWN3_HENB6|nr:hypothetical protein TBLA_0A07450 [Tetrapisispora blattae CBS 6284]CCH58535.1 hypothetical protein TBLA_0A07450 [Tetrapisispora blattae CBS 6284]